MMKLEQLTFSQLMEFIITDEMIEKALEKKWDHLKDNLIAKAKKWVSGILQVHFLWLGIIFCMDLPTSIFTHFLPICFLMGGLHLMVITILNFPNREEVIKDLKLEVAIELERRKRFFA